MKKKMSKDKKKKILMSQPTRKVVQVFKASGKLKGEYPSIRNMCEKLKLDRRGVVRSLSLSKGEIPVKGYSFRVVESCQL